MGCFLDPDKRARGRCTAVAAAAWLGLIATGTASLAQNAADPSPRDGATAGAAPAPPAPAAPPSIPGIMVEPRGWSRPNPNLPGPGGGSTQGCPLNGEQKLELIV